VASPDAALHECCQPGILLCMGLFSRFFVETLQQAQRPAPKSIQLQPIMLYAGANPNVRSNRLA
jgi:hypothetical protein